MQNLADDTKTVTRNVIEYLPGQSEPVTPTAVSDYTASPSEIDDITIALED